MLRGNSAALPRRSAKLIHFCSLIPIHTKSTILPIFARGQERASPPPVFLSLVTSKMLMFSQPVEPGRSLYATLWKGLIISAETEVSRATGGAGLNRL
jgi:hypothetical protein